jgi:H+/Cl- antiporter ClcA
MTHKFDRDNLSKKERIVDTICCVVFVLSMTALITGVFLIPFWIWLSYNHGWNSRLITATFQTYVWGAITMVALAFSSFCIASSLDD